MSVSEFDFSNLNILFLIFLIVMICNASEGYKKGMVKAIISFVSLIITCIVVVLLGNALKSYFDGEIVNVVIMILLLSLLGIIKHFLGIIFFSAKAIAKLPIVNWVNKILGIVFGVFETVLILWTIYSLIMMLDLGMIGQLIMDNIEGSHVLTWLYENNYLAYLIEQIGRQIGS